MAEDSGSVTMSAPNLLKNYTMTVHLRGVRRMCWRLKLATGVIRLGVWLSGMRCVIAWDDEDTT